MKRMKINLTFDVLTLRQLAVTSVIQKCVEATLKEEGVPVETGVFGADMTVSMQGNGPVTLWIDTATDARGL